MLLTPYPTERSRVIAERVSKFVRDVVIPYESDTRQGAHGPDEELVAELRALAREHGVMTPHVLPSGEHLTQLETAAVLKASGYSFLGSTAVNTMAPDEGNMYLLGKVATPEQKTRFLDQLLTGESRSAFFMTEPADTEGAGSDPSMLKTVAVKDGADWVINGEKTFITGALGARVGIVMARTDDGTGRVQATMFLVNLPDPAIQVVKVLDTIDMSMPGGHSRIKITDLRVSADQVLGEIHEGFKYAQVRLSPARLSHCMRWLGLGIRAQQVAATYATNRRAFGKRLIDHEGVGFMLAENVIDLQQAALMVDWCAGILDTGSLGTSESSMAKVAVSDALFRVADRCVQVMGGSGVSRDSIVERFFREIRAFRIYDGPTEVHKWSLARKVKHSVLAAQGESHV